MVQSVTLSNCTPTYKISDASLSQILDCPFQIAAGTYVSMGIGVSTTFQVLVDDATNGLYTDPASSTGLSSTAPSGGAQFVSVTVAGPGGMGNVLSQETFFPQPVTLTATGSVGGDGGAPGVTVDVVQDMIHTLFVNVTGGTPTFDTSLPLPAVQMIPSVEGAGHVEFSTSTGVAGDTTLPGPTDDDGSSVRLFYDASGAPSYLFHPTLGPSQAWAADPAKSTPGTGTNFRAGGYLGIDSSGTLCWAIPQDYSYQSYIGICEMKVVSTQGGSTSLQCANMATVPPPTSGNTYASGCPSITPSSTVSLKLVAQ